MKGTVRRIAAWFLAMLWVWTVVCAGEPVQAADFDVQAPAAVLMEFSTGEILFEKNAHEKRPCASITKVMTMLLVFEALEAGTLQLEQELTASAHAAGMGGSDIWLKEGERMSVEDLIKACFVMSANDAAVVLAEAVAGTEEAFVARMNERARSLGMADTVFKNCNGLDEEGHLTSAHDVAVMSRALLEYPAVQTYTLIWIDYVRNGETQLVNTNKLVRSYTGIIGLKTGTTSAAGSCITAAATREDLTMIAVVLGASDTKTRFSAAAQLMDYGFAGWKLVTPEMPPQPPLPVLHGLTDSVPLSMPESPGVLVSVEKGESVETKLQLPEAVEAPVQPGDPVGTVQILKNGAVVAEMPVTAETSAEKRTFSAVFRLLLSHLLFCGTAHTA